MTMLLTDDPRFRPAMELMDRAEYAEALRHFDALLHQLHANDRLVALYWKVSCLAWLGEVKQARTALEEALSKADVNDPLSLCLELQSAFLLRVEEGPDKAVREIQQLLNSYAERFKTPDLFWAYVQAKTYLGTCLSLAVRYAEAINALEEAISIEHRPLARYYIHFWVGDAYYKLGDLGNAKSHFERALEEAQSAPKAGLSPYYAARLRYELALIAYEQHRFDEAKHQLESAAAVAIEAPDLLR